MTLINQRILKKYIQEGKDLKEKELDKELEEKERMMRNEQMKAFPLTEEEIEKLKKEKRI